MSNDSRVNALLDRLLALSEAELGLLLFRARVPEEYLPSALAGTATRIVPALQMMERRDGGLDAIEDALKWLDGREGASRSPSPVDPAPQRAKGPVGAAPRGAAPGTPPTSSTPAGAPVGGDILLDDLKAAIAQRQALIIVGAGVSIAATGEAVASWKGLLQSGIQRAADLFGEPFPGWTQVQRLLVDSGHAGSMVQGAQAVKDALGGVASGEYRPWLRETVGALRASDRSVLQAIAGLGCPIATTNYDGLLSEITGLVPVLWSSPDVQRVLREDERGILHLHGHWKEPESVILGTLDYARLLGDGRAQALQQAMASLKTLVFIGCGATTEDPNIGALLDWLGQTFSGSEYRHYRIEREEDRAARQGEHPRAQRLFVLGYPGGFPGLAPFLRSLAGAVEPPPPPPPPNLTPLLIKAQRDRHTPRKLPGAAEAVDLNHGYVRLTLWRDREASSLPLYLVQKRAIHAGDEDALKELAEIPRAGIENVLKASPRTVILGDPGCGKTTLLLHLLHRLEGWRLDGADGPHLPVYVPLRTLDPGQLLLPQIAGLLARLSDQTEAKVAAHLKATLAEGRLLLLLDGLDEVDVDKREALSQTIDGLLGTLAQGGAQNRALVTCRVLPYVEPFRLKNPDAVYQVAPLTGEDVPAFVQGFYRSRAEGATLARDLLTRLRLQHSRVNAMTQTPLLLGMLCLYFEEEQDLPERRVALYGRIVERLLLDDKPERGELEFYQEDKLRVLKELAWQAFRADAPLRRKEVEKTILEHGDVGRDRRQARAFLAELKERSGLLCDLNPGQDYTFLHLTFEEYFVALYLAEGERWRDDLGEHAQDEGWAEVWLLLAGQLGEAGGLLEALAGEGVSADLLEAVSRDAGNVSVTSLSALWNLPQLLKRDLGYFPNTPLGAALIGQVQHRPRGLRHALDQFAPPGLEGAGRWDALRRLYLDVLKADEALFRSEGRRLDPGTMYAVVAHLTHALRNQRPGAKEIEAALTLWRAQEPPALAFVEVPGGTYPMGSEEGADGAQERESPLRQVRLDAFRLGRFPVTNAEFEAYDPSHRQGRRFEDEVKAPEKLDRHPVVDVSWYEAWLFAEWVGATLPTEAQWEYGARGPEGADRRGREFPWGDGEPSERLANFALNFKSDVGHTTPVGAYPDGASWCGALDMAGNVVEWCGDWYGPYDHTQTDGPSGPLDGSFRVVRGGSWYGPADWLRGAFRDGGHPGGRGDDVGFRLVAPPVAALDPT